MWGNFNFDYGCSMAGERMGSFRSKENDVSKISTSIFVTNFPENFSAKDLFHSCKVYGHVVDSFIPVKKTNGGKIFDFVRFINVFNVDRLVNNLCTIWVGRFKLHANVARFQRTPIHVNKSQEKSDVRSSNNGVKVTRVFEGHTTNNRSFAHVLKGNKELETVSNPTIMLDDDCIMKKDLSLLLIGKVKEFASLADIKSVFNNEGFVDISIRFMGELWIMLDFPNSNTRDAFKDKQPTVHDAGIGGINKANPVQMAIFVLEDGKVLKFSRKSSPGENGCIDLGQPPTLRQHRAMLRRLCVRLLCGLESLLCTHDLRHTMEDVTLVRKLNAVPDRFLQIVASIEQYLDLDTMSLDEAIGRLKTFEERLKYKNERPEDHNNEGGSNQEKYDQPGLKEDHNNEGESIQKKYDQLRLKEDHNNESGSNHKNMINMDVMKIMAVNLEVASKKGKEKLEHFGVKLEEEKEYHDRKLFHPMQSNKRSIQYNNIKIKEEETSSTSSEDLVIV
nr:nucleotide-binding alpha-beta plait domain-containing protein [Tanacetum cinerariifolium]